MTWRARGEVAVALMVAAHLSFLPWAWGSMHAWSQMISLGLAAAAFLLGLALNPQPPLAETPVSRWRKLAAFPPFWIGLLILGLICAHAFNSAWQTVQFEGMFWIIPVDHVEWLPSGVEAPFERMNAARHLVVLSSAYLTLLTLCLFIARTRLLRLLLAVVLFNGLILTGVGFLQILQPAEKVLWMRETKSQFLASFIYRNHGAAYFNLLLAAAVGFYLFLRERYWKDIGRRKVDASPIFFFLGLTIFTLVVFSQSRAGAAVAVGLGILAFLFSFGHGLVWHRLKETLGLTFLYLLLFAVFTGTFVYIWGWDRITERFARMIDEQGQVEWSVRKQGYMATLEIFQAKPVWGWGAGSFEYVFPAYQEQYPEILVRGRTRLIWEYAHSDPLQLLAEYGSVGAALFLALFLCWAWGFFRNKGYRRVLPLWCAIGAFGALAHSHVDFVFYNPAVFITTVVLFALSYRHAALDRGRRRLRAEGAERQIERAEDREDPNH